MRLVDPARFGAAITEFIEWRTFAYWVRLAVEIEQVALRLTDGAGQFPLDIRDPADDLHGMIARRLALPTPPTSLRLFVRTVDGRGDRFGRGDGHLNRPSQADTDVERRRGPGVVGDRQ